MASSAGWLVLGAGVLAVGGAYLLTRQGGCQQGQVPVQLVANGPGSICAGSDCTSSHRTVCPQLGAAVQYQATPNAGHRFQEFDGPGGVVTTSNPFTATTQVPGFVRATFV